LQQAGGAPLPGAVQKGFEERLGEDLSQVRIHTDDRSATTARQLNAKAFTVGNDVVFGKGQFQPDTASGKRLIAHELTHVRQQRAASPVIQRTPDDTKPNSDRPNYRSEDPNFLLCLALCELGIPPSLWRTVFSYLLQAADSEYRNRLGDLRGSQEFERWRGAVTVMSNFNKLKLIVTFLAGDGMVARLALTTPSARLVQQRALTTLTTAGIRESSIRVASLIVRRIAIGIEVAIAAGCATYCGGTAAANALIEFSTSAMDTITSILSTTGSISGQIGSGIGKLVTHSLNTARASLDASNWALSPLLSRRSHAHLNVISLAFGLAVTPDSFVTSIGRKLSSYNIANVLNDLAVDINTALQHRGGFSVFGASFTADSLANLTPLGLIHILSEYGLLKFNEDPERIADRTIAPTK
jgi:hypothetical protein